MPMDVYDAQNEREHNVIGRELARRRNLRGLSQSALCKQLEGHGVKVLPPAVSRWETGENVPHGYQLLALCHVLGIESPMDAFHSAPALNPEGVDRLESYRADLIATGRYRPVTQEPETIQYIDMPVSLLPVSAGTGNFLDDEYCEIVSVPASFVPDGAEYGIRVSGDSMEPVYQDGQILWVKRCERLRSGEVGVFVYDGCGYLKAYSEQATGQTHDGVSIIQPVLISYNRSKYDPILVQPGVSFQVVGRVLK